MDKPYSLRKYLLANNSHLKRNPESLLIFIDAGKISTNLQANLNFNYQYQLKAIVTDFAEHPDAIIAPLLAWVRVNQIDLQTEDIQFEADLISHSKIDLEITLPLNESVLVSCTDAGFSTEHLAEPTTEYNAESPALFNELFHKETGLTHG